MRAPDTSTLEPTLIAPVSPVCPPGQGPKILVVEPDAARRKQVVRGLAALGYQADAFARAAELPAPCRGPWQMVLLSPTADAAELDALNLRLESAGDDKPQVRSLAPVYETDEPTPSTSASLPNPQPALYGSKGGQGSALRTPHSPEPWSDEAKIGLLRWMAEQGPGVLRPQPFPAAVLGHAYPHVEEHCGLHAGEATRILEDLADFGVLSRKLVNRVHLCPNCRRWTVNFRESCPSCSSLDISIEELIHHFACAYVGLDHEYRHGSELRCPKCYARLNHIGLDYERPRQTYVCASCECLMEDPVLSAQCLDCRWEGGSTEVLAWPVYEYTVSDRGREAIERGELRGLKLREMIHSGRCALASREFLELEVERETYRLKRYGRAMTIMLCRFTVDGMPYSMFHDADRESVREFSRRVAEEVRSLDVAALADARTIAILMPETNEKQAGEAAARLRSRLDGFEIKSASGRPVTREWRWRSWPASGKSGPEDQATGAVDNCEALAWFQQQSE